MTADFVDLVERCRKAQVDFFKGKGDRDQLLFESKRLERLVDLAVKEFKAGPKPADLFSEGG